MNTALCKVGHLVLAFSMQDLGCHPSGVSEYSRSPAPLQAATIGGKVRCMALSQVPCKEDAQSSAKRVSDQGFWPCHTSSLNLIKTFLSFPLHFTSKALSSAMLTCVVPSPGSQSLSEELIAIPIRMIVTINNKQFFQILYNKRKKEATKAIKNPRQDWNLKKAKV